MAAAGRASGTGAGPAGLVITAHAAVRAAGRAAAGPGGGSVTREQGQRLARAELSKLMYRHATSIFERIDHLIDDLLNGASGAMGRTGLIVLAALLAIAIVVVMSVIGPVARSRPRGRSPLLAAGRLGASDHRQQAERKAAAGDYTEAIIESVRAIAVDLEERGILLPRIGRTADEFAAEAGRPLPEHAASLVAVARLFDDVRYGEWAGTAAGYQQARDLDAAIRAARPVAAATAPAATASAPGPAS
ncbi:MAG TPA: DUF4129 domain-containing protein [Streptosporangiaceae bacterium]|nr:DUF4129 domain-containing protein [Streptosporangiaceae bacterium]